MHLTTKGRYAVRVMVDIARKMANSLRLPIFPLFVIIWLVADWNFQYF